MMITSSLPHYMPFTCRYITKPVYIAYQFEIVNNTTIITFYRTFTATTMDTADYWPMA